MKPSILFLIITAVFAGAYTIGSIIIPYYHEFNSAIILIILTFSAAIISNIYYAIEIQIETSKRNQANLQAFIRKELKSQLKQQIKQHHDLLNKERWEAWQNARRKNQRESQQNTQTQDSATYTSQPHFSYHKSSYQTQPSPMD